MPPRKLEPIAIIGTGCRFPGGANSPSKLWDLLREPRDLAKRIPHDRFNIDAFYHPDGSHFGTTDVKESYFLEEDPRRFDSQFFNIQPAEAKALDPQQRLLLETVFEAIESAGVELDSLKGSNTAVYVGLMCDDYSEIVRRDLNTLPTYAVTGTSRAIMSNRISYFFDWRGPSMTIDTACSSSMVAIHQAVQALRNNESRTAVAAGANLIFGPEAYISESNLHMLSSSGRSRMWDAAADGYARGEATGALVLKRLCDAIEDGDHVECIIRETGVNQDGRTQGITMPSETSQAALIRDTYLRAGLDLTKRNDRCQYFEAHGTGTAVGDPKEAEAVATAFFGHEDNVLPDDVLFVGSIKTVVGHTEGTAGIAGVIKASLALQHGVIPQNLHFNQLNPAIEPFYKHLQVPTAATPWPSVPQGQPRRASVNSFGLGGTNAHAILESFEPLRSNLCSKERPEVESFSAVLPFVFSAASEHSLVATIQNFSSYIKTNKSLHFGNLAFTLSQRSVFPFRAAFSALTGPDLVSKMDTQLALFDENPSISCAIRSPTSPCEILGVFTGQGAQWATMGRGLLRSSEPFRRTIVELEASLARLPEKDRPAWSLEEQIMLEASSSRISEAALSQPLCTAIQIALVNLLRIAGIRFGAVVGHSSGEIAAAYAAGFISAYDSIRIAYYRGLLAKHACGPNGKRGAMIAIGVTYQEATELCLSPHFEGRVKLAASNSSSSITLLGDIDAIEEIKVSFDEEKKFARILKIDTAYHSHHMLKCSDMYMQALRACTIQVQTPPVDACSWYSSVYGGMKMVSNHLLKDTYWRENMVGSVLFSQAVQCAIQTNDSLSMTLEVGPHPALKAPVQHTFQEISGSESFYTSTLSRGLNDTEVFAEMLGFVWSHLKPSAVNLSAYGKSIRDDNGALMLMKGLPSYEWDHERVFWNESRCSMLLRTRGDPRHELLGSRLPESIDGEIRWVNFLSPNEIPFVNGHIVQGQKVFPGAGYITMAIEAAMIMVRGQSIKMLEIEDLKILRALGFDDDTTGIETMFTLSSITSRNGAEEVITANFACYSCLNKQAGNMVMMASGTVQAVLGACSDILLPDRLPEDETLTPVHGEPLYTSLAELGYQYSGDFKSLSSMRRKMNNAVGLITNPLDGGSTSSLLVHPAVLDAMFQTMFVAYSSPYDGRLWSLHLPTGVRRITIDPTRCGSDMGSKLLFDAESAGSDPNALSGDVDIFTEDGTTPIMKMEGMAFKPFSEATAADDSELFSEAVWGVASPDGSALMAEVQATEEEMELGQLCERVAYFYYRKLLETVSIAEREKLNLPFHHRSLFNAASEIISQVSEGRHPFARVEWNLDSKKALLEILSKYPHSADFNIMRAVGENLPGVVRGETTILEHMTKDGLLDDYYKHGLGFNPSNELISRMVAQIAHRYPRMNILEIGAGTGGSTKKILPRLDRAFSSYTFTDISTGFFEKAQDIFKDYSSRMIFKKLDIEADTVAQGFENHSYDLVICANVLHATKNLEQTMVNVRRLLKPGGHLVLLEVINNGPMRIGFVMSGLPGWWIGADDGRTLCPTISLDKWDSLLKNTGFSGVDSATPTNDPLPHPASVFATQAVDEIITHIRQPLNSGGVETSIDNLLILGGNTPQTTRLAEDLTWSLRKYCKHVIRIKGLDELHDTDMSPMTTVISLTELDEPIFKTMTEEKWEALKLLFDLSRNVLWVTQGCLENEPYSNMTVGLCRSVCYELPHLQIQLLDVESAEMPEADLLSEMLLRLLSRAGFLGNHEGLLISAVPYWPSERSEHTDLLIRQRAFLIVGQAL
ncbi:Polyketide synthase-nonribosomal peptide synthetase [Lachnellula cervina]|uniref:Polyketide synthase-nonribosomal peptide synthetase n=1 Tax=Lachnellula cervina TaxID=1316786 RepID=A0A7D8YL21_9HELO|nr:Polyketide synthase-nonribosomal peptide synthetase [Lachnellula cervina]